MRARDVLGPGSPLSQLLPAYEDRPAQLAMAEAVEEALGSDTPLFAEAGTGTGKTLAYLVPAVLSGRKVIVSTATRALQEQIFAKDLPLVREALAPFDVEVRASLMKGLSNYLCKRRHAELGGAGSEKWLARIDEWARETETGDRAELVSIPEDADAWQRVQSSTETRVGARCPFYEECFVTRMRREAEEAQIVVVNHHLFFADLALRRGRGGDYASAIPNYDAVIFDEAHQLEDIATDFFGVRVSSSRVDALVRDARRALLGAGGDLAAAAGALGDLGGARPILDLIDETSRAFFGALTARARSDAEARRVLGEADWSADVLAAHGKLDACLEAFAARAQLEPRGGGSSSGAWSKAEAAVAIVTRRALELREDLRAIVDGARAAVDPQEGTGDARVAWLDARDGSRRSVSLGASPIDLGPTLREALFDRVPGVIMTSATLATAVPGSDPSFHFAKRRLGAPPEIRELVVPSPFDFASRAALYVTRQMPDPAQPSWDEVAASRAAELVEVARGGAFVLCTSTRAMRRMHAALRARLPHPVLVQGEAPKHLLLSKFRAMGDAVLVATMSFWEGVDVPGRALRLVVIDKIPFAVPTDPVVSARCHQIEQSGGNAFTQYSVPSAAITLKQGFGRLIRTQTDAGIVAILDPRVLTRGYGRILLASLPPARQIRDIDQLRAFWLSIDESCTAT